MIEINLSDPDIVVLHPEGALSKEDFKTLTETIDRRINETDKVPNIVIQVDKLPHWDSVGALTKHFHFVRQHGKIIGKVALVGDSPLLTVAPEIANKLVNAMIRRFPANKFEEAKEWARSADDHPGYFEVIEGLPDDVLALRVVGIITAQDYDETLAPLVEKKLKKHDKLKCLIVLDDEYTTYAGDAAWSDTKFGIAHMRDFTHLALVTDISWIKNTASLFMMLASYKFKAFTLAELEEAKSWIKC